MNLNETHKEEVKFIVENSDKNLPEILRMFANKKIKEQSFIYSVMPSFFRERRKMLGLPMKTITDDLGISEATLSRLENGHDVMYSIVRKVEKYLRKNAV